MVLFVSSVFQSINLVTKQEINSYIKSSQIYCNKSLEKTMKSIDNQSNNLSLEFEAYFVNELEYM